MTFLARSARHWRTWTRLRCLIRASPQQIYDRERTIVDSYRVVPLVWLPQVYGLSARVRDWKAPAAGRDWPLADVWLDGPPNLRANRQTVTFRTKLFWIFTLALLLSVGWSPPA